MGNISRHFDSEPKWSTFGMYSEQVRKSRAWRNSWHSFIRKKKMVYCVAVACNNSLRGACVSYFWVTPNLCIPRSACGSSEVCQLLRHNSSQSSLGENKFYFLFFTVKINLIFETYIVNFSETEANFSWKLWKWSI